MHVELILEGKAPRTMGVTEQRRSVVVIVVIVVIVSRELPYIRSYTVYIYNYGQPHT